MTLGEWVAGYRKAWEANSPADIGALFTEDARYYPEPYAEPWQGRQEIVKRWLEIRDEPGVTTFEWTPLTDTAELAIVQGRTIYQTPPERFSNLWVIRFAPGGRCREFTEWWMKHEA